MAFGTRICARVSADINEELERFVRQTGVSRSHFIEQALLHHLQALRELPAEAIVPARLVLDAESAERVRELSEHAPEPTKAMKRLFDER